MCINCNFLLKPFPPHKPDVCPLLLQCAYCSTCGIHNGHFPSNCPKKPRGVVPLYAHLRYDWKNANDLAELKREKVFRMVDDEDTYKEYCKTHNIVLANTLEGLRQKVTHHLESRGYKRETYKDGLSVYRLPEDENEEKEPSTKVEPKKEGVKMEAPVEFVPIKRRLKKLSK